MFTLTHACVCKRTPHTSRYDDFVDTLTTSLSKDDSHPFMNMEVVTPTGDVADRSANPFQSSKRALQEVCSSLHFH
jgi:hypothetical protein